MECEIVEFSYEGQLIEIVNAGNTVFRNPETNQWEQEIINFEDSELVEVLGISVPLIPKQQLIAYKKKLGREVDLIDIEQLS